MIVIIMVMIVNKNKSRRNKTIIGGAYSEIPVTDKDQSKLDKLKNFTVIKIGSINDSTETQAKLNKFVNLKLN